jgi:hypothetical protein
LKIAIGATIILRIGSISLGRIRAMKKWVIAGVATVALVGTGLGVAAYAQSRHHQFNNEERFDRMIERMQYGDRGHMGWRKHRQWSAEDRAAFLDARIAGVKAGLKLSAEQEKLWGPVETTVRDLGKKWGDRFAARREEMQKRRAEFQDGKEPPAFDPVDRLKKRADTLAERAADMKRFAEVAQPLYASLDEGQKNRLQSLLRHRRGGMMHRWNEQRQDGPRGPG